MYLLDTDTLSNYLKEGRNNAALTTRIVSQPRDSIFISIVTVEEILAGILSEINKARGKPRNPQRLMRWHDFLQRMLDALTRFQTLPFNEAAEQAFQSIPPPLRRLHSRDCHFAAIALANRSVVITANIRHFQSTPSLECEDWTVL